MTNGKPDGGSALPRALRDENLLFVAKGWYSTLLLLPISMRISLENQKCMANLRDFIAEKEGRSSEDVQTEFEAAAWLKTRGG